jgi:hypothetical protein
VATVNVVFKSDNQLQMSNLTPAKAESIRSDLSIRTADLTSKFVTVTVGIASYTVNVVDVAYIKVVN